MLDVYYDARIGSTERIAIQLEEDNQHAKWGSQNITLPEWLMYIGEEYGEACEAVADLTYHRNGEDYELRERAYVELTQLATLTEHLMAILRENVRYPRIVNDLTSWTERR